MKISHIIRVCFITLYFPLFAEILFQLIIKDDSNLSSNDNINLVFLSSSEDYFPWVFWKNYFIEQKDSSTDMSFQKIGLTGYGGNYNFYYFDLYAMPWIELDLEGYFDSDMKLTGHSRIITPDGSYYEGETKDGKDGEPLVYGFIRPDLRLEPGSAIANNRGLQWRNRNWDGLESTF